MNSPMYYAENLTDKKIRERFFPDFGFQGVMVEVGGGTPEFISMSKHFRDSGWRTLVVEPNPLFVAQHRALGNEVYQFACGETDKDDVPFTVVSQEAEFQGGTVTDHAFSSFALKPGYAAILPADARCSTIQVDMRRLDGILTGLNLLRVDLLSVDVEGWEIEVLKGFDTSRIQCQVIVIENLHHDTSYESYMNGIGYRLAMKVDYNYVFTKATLVNGLLDRLRRLAGR